MENKIVVVTGSSSGIGRAAALKFAELGCKLVIHGTDKERIKQVADECSRVSPANYKPVEVVADFSVVSNVNLVFRSTIENYNGIDILVNNAGLFKPVKIDEAEASDTFDLLMNINLNSAVHLTKLFAPYLLRSSGCIINISSNLHAKCIEGGFAYCTSKASLTMFTKSIAVDLAPKVRVNSISPGPIATRMSTRCGMSVEDYEAAVGEACLINRVGEPEEVARMIIFLASPESALITGSDFIIDGGSTIKPAGRVMGQD